MDEILQTVEILDDWMFPLCYSPRTVNGPCDEPNVTERSGYESEQGSQAPIQD